MGQKVTFQLYLFLAKVMGPFPRRVDGKPTVRQKTEFNEITDS